jgi:DUF438 domain-containing protein
MDKVDKLVEVLKRLNSGENPEQVRDEARDLLADIDPEDLSFAEQKLVDEGLAPSELQNLCEIHMEVLGDEVERMKRATPAGHVVHTLVSEHERILEFLDELEQLNKDIQDMDCCSAEDEKIARLLHIAEHLVETEPHHEREEQILFPELEKRGVTGPPNIMRMEHDQLRPEKRRLRDLAECMGNMDFDEFKRQVDIAVKFIVPTLRDHIYKENNILYPTSVKMIDDENLWEKMKERCDEIGYCCFTPEK